MPKLPAARACLIAEQIRPEPGNKSTILGFVGVSPDAEINLPLYPTQINIAMLILCEKIEVGGDMLLEIELRSGDKLLFPRTPLQGQPTMEVGRRAVCAINLMGLPIEAPGTITLSLYSDNEFHSSHSFICEPPLAAKFTPKPTILMA